MCGRNPSFAHVGFTATGVVFLSKSFQTWENRLHSNVIPKEGKQM